MTVTHVPTAHFVSNRMLRTLKLASLATLRSVGITGLVGRTRWRRARLLILGYHGVALDDESDWNGALFLTEATLRQRFETLRRTRATVLRLEEALVRLQRGTLPERAVVLTFDDGFADFSRLAYPLLQEFGFPATVYLTTYYVDHQLPVFTVMLRYLLWKGRARSISLDGLGTLHGAHALAAHESRAAVDLMLRDMADAAQLDARARDELLAQVATRLGLDYEAIRASRVLSLMSADEVAAMDPALVTVHLHTHRHRVPVVHELFQRELTENGAAIAQISSRWKDSRHFCYPSGVTHPDFLPWMRELGILSATTCFSGLAEAGTEPLMLPRLLDTSQLTDLEFESWVTGVAASLPRRPLQGER